MHDIDPAGGRSSAANPLPWQQARRAEGSADLPDPPTGVVVRAILITVGLFAAAGVLGGWLWAQFADPPAFEVVRANAFMGEEQAGRQFGVDVAFALVGLALSTPLGLLTGWRWHRVGWPQAVAGAVSAGGAAIIAWRLGISLGPEDPEDLLSSARIGDLLPERLDVHAEGLLLAWPVGALVGFVIAVLLFSRPSPPPSYGGPPPEGGPWRDGSDPRLG